MLGNCMCCWELDSKNLYVGNLIVGTWLCKGVGKKKRKKKKTYSHVLKNAAIGWFNVRTLKRDL